jgi:alpha-beta hydrolase superfamily lysophospholipase
MTSSDEWTFDGTRTSIVARKWVDDARPPRYVTLLAHGYGEHIGRYEHVASALVEHGSVVYGLDHMGHGKSGGERVLVEDFEDIVTDLRTLDRTARDQWPDLPVVLIGHSMGGLIAARYAQQHGTTLAALVLSGPAIGDFALIHQLLALDEIPDVAVDVTTLSRDPLVGQTYDADPLVWHGPFKRRTLESFAATIDAIDAGGSLGDLPTLWVHGVDDQLVPIDGTRAGIERLRGSTFRQHEYAGARHEVFNETNSDDVLADVMSFIDEVLAP